MEIVKLKVKDLKPFEKNAKKHPKEQIQQIVNSIEKFGMNDPIGIDENNMVLEGHGRLLALKQMGIDEVDCICLTHMSDIEKRAYILAHNQTTLNTGFETLILKGELEFLKDADFDLGLTGFSMQDITDLFHEKGKTVDDEFNPDEHIPVEPIAKMGDIFQLGRHRLMCGDSTIQAYVDLLMNGNKVDCVVTDPPYGVDYAGKNEFLNKFDKGNSIQKDIENDNITNYRQFFGDFLKCISFKDYNAFYIFMSGQELHNLRLALDDCNLKCCDYLIWLKNNHVLGRKDYNSKHEFCVYGWKGKHKFYGGFQTTIQEFARPVKSDLHPTMKPIPLLAKLIEDGSLANFIVYDAFGGSGSTLIACEQTDRICYMMELDPKYCDVICKRYELATGNKAVLIKGGESVGY